MPVDRNAIGVRGEAIVTNLLTRRHGRDDPLFRPHFMGDKYPTIDFFVELVGAAGSHTPFFLAQVKATASGYTSTGRLRTRVASSEMADLARYPAPTYIIAVDEVRELGFLVAALVGGQGQYRSVPTRYPLAEGATLDELYDEVRSFWTAHALEFRRSRFT